MPTEARVENNAALKAATNAVTKPPQSSKGSANEEPASTKEGLNGGMLEGRNMKIFKSPQDAAVKSKQGNDEPTDDVMEDCEDR